MASASHDETLGTGTRGSAASGIPESFKNIRLRASQHSGAINKSRQHENKCCEASQKVRRTETALPPGFLNYHPNQKCDFETFLTSVTNRKYNLPSSLKQAMNGSLGSKNSF